MNTSNTNQAPYKSGYVAVIGRPNVGKSTLINQILQQKLSIVSHKPQTTRHQILAIHSTPNAQIVFIDTPGIHNQKGTALNKHLNQTAQSSSHGVDAVLFLVEALKWTDEDLRAAKVMAQSSAKKILVVNKVDKVKDKQQMIPFVEKIMGEFQLDGVHYISALKNKHIDPLLRAIHQLLPEGPPIFDEDQVSDRSTRFFITELIREQLMERFHQELPYSVTVNIEAYEVKGNMHHIHANIWVERNNQKRIIIGSKGEAIKQIGINARREIEQFIEQKVNLKLWVKVKSSWTDDIRAIESLGYTDEFKD
ncbi:GTPase Era [Marinicella sp. S1101]|uniref:GTPase Era n=1 Tax=Marinicella marina TaxID=2996016 RepID=UPI002260EBE7|nr:GTPase Era [Marinicella marina]MCX7555014.1 GTPase Era [Marinicella marina]MDJ1141322.1 GTPase Era [Marinicella marina]